MWLGVLGPLQVRNGDIVIPVPAAKQRIVLGTLLVRANRVVPAERLTEALWDRAAPASARVTLRTYVQRLRVVLGPVVGARIRTGGRGYLMHAGDGEVDLLRFIKLCAAGSAAARAGSWQRAEAVLTEALGLWRGAPLADVPSEVL